MSDKKQAAKKGVHQIINASFFSMLPFGKYKEKPSPITEFMVVICTAC